MNELESEVMWTIANTLERIADALEELSKKEEERICSLHDKKQFQTATSLPREGGDAR